MAPKAKAAADKGGVKKATKKPKDKDAPKRGASAYIHFCNDKRADVQNYACLLFAAA